MKRKYLYLLAALLVTVTPIACTDDPEGSAEDLAKKIL